MVEKRYGVKENEARAFLKMCRCSPQKLNLVAESIRGLAVGKAVEQLNFSKKRIAAEVKKLLLSAISNADHNYKLDVDKLFVKEAYVGKALVMKRFHARARGRGAAILKPFSNITIIVAEGVASKKIAKTTGAKKTKPNTEKKEAK